MAGFPSLDYHQGIIHCIFGPGLICPPGFMEIHSHFSEMFRDKLRGKTITSLVDLRICIYIHFTPLQKVCLSPWFFHSPEVQSRLATKDFTQKLLLTQHLFGYHSINLSISVCLDCSSWTLLNCLPPRKTSCSHDAIPLRCDQHYRLVLK